MEKPAVLMTDPRHFEIRGGANPHTRNPDDTLKSVEREKAVAQWHSYVDQLLDGGVDVYVIEAVPEATGMVFTANAGFLRRRLEPLPTAEKQFYVSHFTAEHRQVESPLFSAFMEKFGFDVSEYPDDWRFEGEADAFPVGRGDEKRWFFTYGFRTDPKVHDWLEDAVVGEPMLRMKLTNPAYYHGDCLLCDLGGPFLAWSGGLEEEDAAHLREELGDRAVWLDDEDAEDFVGNSFYVETATDRLLYSPAAIRPETRERIESHGVTVVPVEISEFFGKGGGGPKCMVFNLGELAPDEKGATPEVQQFRNARHIETMRKRGHFG